MAQTYRKVRIFVASPGDVSDERARLARVVGSMNRTGSLAERLGMTLELLRWETHVAPDVGRPQGVVFDQLSPDDWDIFVGILWMRFGTKTGKVDPETREDYRSGTEEEFKEALRRRMTGDTGWPKIMFYRCVRVVDPLKIDAIQYARVQEFFKQFETNGQHPGLVSQYAGADEFERLVRDHLEHAIFEYDRQWQNRVQDEAGASVDVEGRGAATAKDTGVGEGLPHENRTVTMPGLFRYMLDRYLPTVHRWLATRTKLFGLPPEWRALHDYLTTLRSTIANDIAAKTYVEPHTKALPEDADRFKAKRTGFLTPVQQLIKEIVGVSHGGDAQNAQISAISKKSKFVHDIVQRLLEADEPLILLGDPGTGKSITLQQAAMQIAERESKRLFPNVCLFIRLGEFQLSGEINSAAVWEYVKKSAPQEIRPFIDSLAEHKRLVIFFDGIDEMSRERYNEYTTALSVFAGSKKGDIKTLFSCRITDFTPRFQHNRLVLLPFSRKHIYHYLKRQIPRFPITIGGRSWSARQLAARLAQGGLPMQADNPFVLWLLCTYLQEEQDWPQSRVHLLEYYNRFNYQRKTGDVSREGMNSAFLTWGRIAYEITDRNKGAVIPFEDVEDFLASEELPAVRVGVQCGVLQTSLDLETTLIRFEHHRFQEYFTAFYLNRDQAAKSALNWLDKLDAPRWQETLLNLVLMGGGREALIALNEAIRQDLERLEALWDERDASEAARVETLLADRVELASRVLQQTQQRPDAMLTQLSVTFRTAAYWLTDHGNPITKVKMLWASKIVPGIDMFRVAREPLSSDVSWVRQQALIVTSVASGEVGEGALQEDVLHSFASGRFLNRLGGYIRIAAALKQKRLWAVLVIGLVLCLLQLLAGFGLVAAARAVAAPTFSAIQAGGLQAQQRNLAYQESEAILNNDVEEQNSLKDERENNARAQAESEEIVTAARRSLESWWFLIMAPGAMLLTLLYTMRRAPEHHFLALQSIGYICVLLPFILWPLWFGYWLNIWGILVLTLPILVLLISAVSWSVTLFIHALMLMLFAASAYPWTGPTRKKRMFLEAMWENCGFRVWGNKIIVYSRIPVMWVSTSLLAAALSIIGWQTIAATIGLLPFVPPVVNIMLSTAVYAEVISCAAALVWGIKLKEWKQSLRIFIASTIAVLTLSIIVLAIWGLSAVKWRIIWAFIVATFGLLPFVPPLVNVALSIAIYTQIIGCTVALVSGLMHRRWDQSLKVITRCMVLCLWLAMSTFLVWALIIFSTYLGQTLAIILTFALAVLLLMILFRLTIDMVRYLLLLRLSIRYAWYNRESWKQELPHLAPDLQAMLLRRTTPETLGLRVSDFLELLQEVEFTIQKEPALSAYWAKRYQIEQIMRQERSG